MAPGGRQYTTHQHCCWGAVDTPPTHHDFDPPPPAPEEEQAGEGDADGAPRYTASRSTTSCLSPWGTSHAATSRAACGAASCLLRKGVVWLAGCVYHGRRCGALWFLGAAAGSKVKTMCAVCLFVFARSKLNHYSIIKTCQRQLGFYQSPQSKEPILSISFILYCTVRTLLLTVLNVYSTINTSLKFL